MPGLLGNGGAVRVSTASRMCRLVVLFVVDSVEAKGCLLSLVGRMRTVEKSGTRVAPNEMVLFILFAPVGASSG